MAELLNTVGEINLQHFAERLGVDLEILEESWKGEALPELKYREISPEDQLRLEQEAAAAQDKMAALPSLDQKVDTWEERWGQLYAEICSTGVTMEKLRPKYFGGRILRLDGRFINAFEENFEFNLHLTTLRALFQNYLDSVDRVVDLGCGSGTSLYLLAEMFPELTLYGGDWSPVSQKILSEIAARTGINISGFSIDLRNDLTEQPIPINADTAVISIHAFEQLGEDYGFALDLLLKNRPKIILQIEPIYEFYDPQVKMDHLAILHHDKEHYLKGYLTKLQALADEGRIEIRDQRRLFFGGAWHEAYSLLVWRPI